MKLRSRLLQISLFFLCSFSLLAQGLVCRKPGIDGFDVNASRAHRFLRSTTSSVSGLAVYVEKTSHGFYFHSNFLTPGFDNPTKIRVSEAISLRQAMLNLVFAEKPSIEERDSVVQALHQHAQIYMDESMFTEAGYPLIDIGNFDHVSVVNGRTGGILIGSVDRLDRVDPPPVLMARVVGCCLFGIPPHLAESYQTVLSARKLEKEEIRFLSLVKDSGTESAIRSSNSLRQLRIGRANQPATTLAEIESAFRAASGKTVVLMSHVEGSNFVIRNAASSIISTFSVESVRELAGRYNIQLIDLGCETAQQLRSERLGIGVTTKFNTVDAVRALDRAVANSSNFSEFFQHLTSQDLRIVIDHGFMQDWPLCADIYSKAQTGNAWVKLARVFVNFRSGQQS